MSERGYFVLDRRWFDHPSLANEPFTERDAWAWLISEAAFRPHKKRVLNTVFDLARGQLVHSVRFMADAWQWTPTKTYRFLNRLKIDTMIETQPKHDATLVTICNYDKFQIPVSDGEMPSETPIETPAKRPRYRLEETKLTEVKEEREIEPASDGFSTKEKPPKKASLHLENPDFERFWAQYPKKTDIGSARRLFDHIVVHGTATPSDLISGAMRYGAQRSGEDDRYTKSPVKWLEGQCWLDELPKSQAPLRENLHARKTKADTAIEGMMSYFAEREER